MNNILKKLTFPFGILFFIGSLLVIIFLGYKTYDQFKRIIVSQSQQQLFLTTATAAKSLEEFITIQKSILKSFATDPILQNLNIDTDYNQLEIRYKELGGDIGGFYILSPEGIVTHRFPHKDRVGKDFSTKPGVSAVLRSRKSHVSELFYSDSGKPCLTVLEPIFSNGKFRGILRSLSYIDTIQKKYLDPIKVGSRGYAWVIDNQQRIVMHPKSEYIGKGVVDVVMQFLPNHMLGELQYLLNDIVQGHEGVDIHQSVWWEEKSSQEAIKLTAYAPVDLDDQLWSIAISMDYSEISTPIKKQAQILFVLAMFVILLFGAIGFLFYQKQKKEVVLEAEAENMRKLSESAEALRMSEEKLNRAKKMEALGLLAGGVAHDLNNVLSGIVSYPELLLLDLPEDSELRKPIETIKDAGIRSVAVVQDLLTVARGVAIERNPTDLNQVIQNYLGSPEFKKLIHFHPNVQIRKNLDPDAPVIIGSDVHILKVIMNLVSNASEALPGNGIVTISTHQQYLDRPLSGYEDIYVGEYAVLTVADNGPGISPYDMEHIFEPFYTKKVMGRSGTGLGLAVVWNIMQDHMGYVCVNSSKQGTTFELYFPITSKPVMTDEEKVSMDAYKGNGEKILVVDDLESQREISGQMLETLNYKVHAVSSGDLAVDFLKHNSVNLVLLDMIMDPGINGRETYEKIKEIQPNQKVIIASGFAETEEVLEAKRLGAGQYIKKPLTLEKLGMAIKSELAN